MIAPEEQTVLDSVNTDLAWGLIERFTTLKREHPNDVRTAADEITSRLRDLGVPFEVLEPDLYLSLPGTAKVEHGDSSFRAKPMAMSRPANGLTAPLAYFPGIYAKGADDIFTRVKPPEDLEMAGKIIVTEGFGMPGKVAEVELKGGLGMIAVNPGQNPHWGICTTVWGTPDLHDLPRKPKITVMAVNNPDGEALIAAAKRGDQATLHASLEEGWYASPIPVVTIPGTEEPEKFVLLHGHYDSWDYGIGDNAVGDGAMLEIARVLWEHRATLKRSVKIAWWPGHSTGRYAGSTWFADHYGIDLFENCIAHVNCDSPGCRWASTFKDLSVMFEAETFVTELIKDIAGPEVVVECERPHQAGDYSFNNIGLSGYLMLSSTMPDDLRSEKGYYAVGGCGANIAWHTEDDTIEIADKDNLLRDIKVYLAAVRRAANATVAPFDFARTIKDFSQTLEERQGASGTHFSFEPARSAIGQLETALEGFKAYTATLEGAAITDARVVKANHALRRLARLLVPVNYTSGPAFFHDPAETTPSLPDLAPALDLPGATPEMQGFIKTHLTRGQNRLVAALRDAALVVREAMN